MVCDADSAVNSAAFNQLVTSKGFHHFNGFGCSIDALPSVPPMGKLTDNFSNNNSKRHMCVIYFISFDVFLMFRFVASFVESTSTSIEWPIVQLYPFDAVGKWSAYVTGSELQPIHSWCSGSHFGRWTQIESSLMRVFALRCPKLHSNWLVVALLLRWCRQHPMSAVEKVVVEPMAEAVSAPLPISIESIRLSFFRKSTRKNWGKEKTATHVNYINGNLMVCDCIDKNFNKTNY